MKQEKRVLGKSGIEIDPIGLGLWAIGGDWWGNTDDADSLSAIDAALDAGVNFYDTADVYGMGHSETLLGQAMKGRRDKFVVATKIGWIGFDEEKGTAYTTVDKVVEAAELALKRMGIETIDLLFSHINHQDPTMETMIEGLQKLQKDGKIRSYGLSTSDFDYIQAFNGDNGCSALQIDYSLLNRTPEAEIFPYCQEHDIGIVTRGSLAMGRLTGKFTPDSTFHESDTRQKEWIEDVEQKAMFLEDLEKTAQFQALCGEQAVAEFALRFAMTHPAVTVVIPGAKTAAQVRQNAVPLGLPNLSAGMLAAVDEIVPSGGGRKIWPA